MQAASEYHPHPTVGTWLRSIGARFDSTVLRPPSPAAAAAATDVDATRAASAGLLAWCFAGAGDGRGPWWRPWALPRVGQRCAVATWPRGPENTSTAVLEAFARYLDGSDQLAAAGRWSGLGLRLRVKVYDAWGWRARRSTDPWDVGWLIGDVAAWQRFRPRRATLIVVDERLSDTVLIEAVQIFLSHSASYRHPVRLLIVGRSIEALARSISPSNVVAIAAITGPLRVDGRVSEASASNASASR